MQGFMVVPLLCFDVVGRAGSHRVAKSQAVIPVITHALPQPTALLVAYLFPLGLPPPTALSADKR